MWAKSFVLLPLLYIFSHAQGPSQADAFLTRLEGNWQGDGTAFGMPARLHVKGEWVLGNKFLRLSLKNEMRGANGQSQIFEGHAYYSPVDGGGYVGKWFDSRGKSFPIKAQRDTESLVAFWGSPDDEEGRSVYRFVEPGKIEVVDSVRRKDGTWREFGRFLLKRE